MGLQSNTAQGPARGGPSGPIGVVVQAVVIIPTPLRFLPLREESGLGRVTDPAGGAWYVERLTDELARAAWAVFQEVEAAGGMAAALSPGMVADRIAAVREERGGGEPRTGS